MVKPNGMNAATEAKEARTSTTTLTASRKRDAKTDSIELEASMVQTSRTDSEEYELHSGPFRAPVAKMW